MNNKGGISGLKWHENFVSLADGTTRKQTYDGDGKTSVDDYFTGSIKFDDNSYWYYNKNQSLLTLDVGTYYLIEEEVSPLYGFTVNKNIQKFTITENHTTTLPYTVR